MILPPATLAQAGTLTRKPWRGDQGSPRKNRPAHAEHALTASGHAWTRNAPRRPQKPPDGRTGGRICKPHRHRNGPQRATGNAIHGNGVDANATRKRRTGTGRKKIKPGEITPGKRKCSTEPPRRRHAKRAGGRQQGSKTPQQGRPPPGRKENPPEALPPAGLNYLSRALSTAPQKMRA